MEVISLGCIGIENGGLLTVGSIIKLSIAQQPQIQFGLMEY